MTSRYFLVIAALALLLASGACSRSKLDALSPHENLLSIVSEFELLAATDPYRESPAEDLNGRSIARATVVRLANYESLHPGRFAPEVLAYKARAFERLGDLESARRCWSEAAEYDSPLREECLRKARLAGELLELRRAGGEAETLDGMLDSLSQRRQALARFASESEEKTYRALAMIEVENADVARAEMLAANRWTLADGEDRAIEAFRQLVAAHRESRRSLEHVLRLAGFHRELAIEEIRLRPPGTVTFQEDRVFGLIDEALDLLYRVSQADGEPERLVAARELDAVLALREWVSKRAD